MPFEKPSLQRTQNGVNSGTEMNGWNGMDKQILSTIHETDL